MGALAPINLSVARDHMVKHIRIIFATWMLMFPFGVHAAGCAEYEDEALAISGVVPKFDERGRLLSILMHGEATFLSNKRSLINAARTKAELSAKQAMSSFLQESVSARQKAGSLLEQVELTRQDGSTEGRALELTSVVETMQNDTDAVLQGIVKLDECVDTEQNYLLVTLGWKPDTNPEMRTADSREYSASESESARAISGTKISPELNSKTGCVNNILMQIVNSIGYGQTQNEAISDGLRVAISQTYGEVLSSSIAISAESVILETTNEQARTSGVSTELTSQAKQISSSTAGIVTSFNINDVKRIGQTFEVEMSVNIPTACNFDSTEMKRKAVILTPAVTGLRDWTDQGDKLAITIKLELESLLNETMGFSVLSRSDSDAVSVELNSITVEDYPIDQLIKKGNKLAADVLVITEFSDFETKRELIDVGPEKSVEMYVTTAQAWVRVVDVATSNLVTSIRVPFSSKSVNKDQGIDAFSITMAHNIASVLGEKVGGGFSDSGAKLLASTMNRLANYEKANERIKHLRQNLERAVENDW